MFETKNDLTLSIRSEMTRLLQCRLADAIDLLLQTKLAHWNVKGPTFMTLHELFDQIHEECEGYVDVIAERITQLGGNVEGTAKSAAKNSSLPDYPTMISTGEDHAQAISTALAEFSKNTRQSIEEAAKWRDPVTADIFTEITRAVDKNLWFVESHLPQHLHAERREKGAA